MKYSPEEFYRLPDEEQDDVLSKMSRKVTDKILKEIDLNFKVNQDNFPIGFANFLMKNMVVGVLLFHYEALIHASKDINVEEDIDAMKEHLKIVVNHMIKQYSEMSSQEVH